MFFLESELRDKNTARGENISVSFFFCLFAFAAGASSRLLAVFPTAGACVSFLFEIEKRGIEFFFPALSGAPPWPVLKTYP